MGGAFRASAAQSVVIGLFLTLSVSTIATSEDGVVAAPGIAPPPLGIPRPTSAQPLLVAHDPIRIDGDGGFTAANGTVSGNGTVGDPFVIAGWEIRTALEAGIEIQNTQARFVVRDVSLVGVGSVGDHGVVLLNVTNARIENVSSVDSHLGIRLDYVRSTTIHGNTLNSSWGGILVFRSTGVTITENLVNESEAYGVQVSESMDVLVRGNRFTRNAWGVEVDGHSGVRVHHNDFVGNTVQANDYGGSENQWDDGYPSGGNNWSDYAGWDDCAGSLQDICTASDGIGDLPYRIDDNSLDRYPILTTNPPNRLPVASLVVGAGPWFPENQIPFDARNSFDPEGYPLRYGWDFGDGTRVDGPDYPWIAHSYSGVGHYQVSLTVTDVRGGAASAAVSVSVETPPWAEPMVLWTYEHPSAGFRLPIPEGWKIEEDVVLEGITIELFLSRRISGTLLASILVETDVDPTVRETEAYLRATADGALAEIRAANPTTSVDLMEGPSFRTIGDHAGVTFELQYGTGEAFQKIAIVVSEPHQRYWIFVFTAGGQPYAGMEEGFDRMLSGFAITLAPVTSGPTTSGPDPAGVPWPVLVGSGVVALVLIAALVAILVLRSRKPAFIPPLPPQLAWSPPAVSPPAAPAVVVPRLCAACGEGVVVGARFCGRCGTAHSFSSTKASGDTDPPRGE